MYILLRQIPYEPYQVIGYYSNEDALNSAIATLGLAFDSEGNCYLNRVSYTWHKLTLDYPILENLVLQAKEDNEALPYPTYRKS